MTFALYDVFINSRGSGCGIAAVAIVVVVAAVAVVVVVVVAAAVALIAVAMAIRAMISAARAFARIPSGRPRKLILIIAATVAI